MSNRVCRTCIHYDVCLLYEDNFIDDVAKNGFCGKFTNKDDIVKVVRCKDCVNRVEFDTNKYHCQNTGYYCGETGYCSDGVPKERLEK